ncbi:MAG: primase [Bacillales bacterium]|nr:primase [Bacillales bacterium]
MSQRIPEETVLEIKNKNDIVDIVGEYVQLKKQGRNYFGLCPFHGEKTSSFSVAADKQIFHCFGCGAGGNVFSFLMDIEGISFVEAAKKLADRSGVPLDVDVSSNGEKQHSALNDMLEAHEFLRGLYHTVLLKTKQGEEALKYLLNRGFTKDSIEKFQIGYAIDSWNYTTDLLSKKGYSLDRMEQAGLLIKRETENSYVDRFRHRIMFPILDRQGKTIAFSGRALASDENKYLNSPETVLFNKSKVLYNFQNARASIRKRDAVVLFEGFADVISADRAGVDNGIATMGTAFTNEHLQILSRTTKNFIVCYDADNAGINAANKVADLIHHHRLNVRIAVMPEGYDPDEFIRSFGAEKFQNEVISAANSYISFKMFYHRRGKNFTNDSEKMVYIETILEEIAKLYNEVERDYYLRLIAEEFNLSIDALLRQNRKMVKQNNKEHQKKEERNFSNDVFVKKSKLKPAYQVAEENLISFMLRDRLLADKINQKLNGETMLDVRHQAIIMYLISYYNEGRPADTSLFLNYLQNQALRMVVTEIEMKSLHLEPSEKEINDCISQIGKQKQLEVLQQKEHEQKEAERKKDFNLASQLALEIIEIKKSL